MDNITHSLIGVGLFRVLPKKLQRPEIFWTAIIGNNIPDSDVLERFIPNTDDLNYLIHHRGYTHAFLFAIPLGIIVGIILNKIFKKPWNSAAAILIGAGSAVLHILADLMNNYGVHPFTPFVNRWFYGDSVFIVEPLLWCALIPVAILTVEKRWAKIAWGAVLLTLLIGIWFLPWLGATFSLIFGGIGALTLLLILRTKRAEIGLTLAALSLALFFISGNLARGNAQGAWLNAGLTDEDLLDVESTPSPGNPFCWRVWVRTENDRYLISRVAAVSLLPIITAPVECPGATEVPKKADLSVVLLPSNPKVTWTVQSDLRKDLHAQLIEKSCRYRRFLNFARLPYLHPIGKSGADDGWIAGDLRYDRGEELGFSDFVVTLNDECDSSTDVWDRPTERNSRAL